MNRTKAIPYIGYVLDDALAVHPISELRSDAVLVGWQCGFEPMFVAVQSYLPGVIPFHDEAVEIAIDYLMERDWFADKDVSNEPDYIIGKDGHL